MRFGSPRVPFQMGQNTLCIVKKGKNWKPAKAELTGDALLGFFTALSNYGDNCRSCYYTYNHDLYQGETNFGVFFRFRRSAGSDVAPALQPAQAD